MENKKKTNYTNEQLEEARQNKEIGDMVAKRKGYTDENGNGDIKTLMNEARTLLNGNAAERLDGERLAKSTVEDLLLLCLYQELEGTPYAEYLNFADKFEDGYISNGNSKEYVATNDMGHDSWVPTEFVPSEISTTNIDKYVIQMYTRDSISNKPKLNTEQAYQFRKKKVIQEPNWLPYFMSGKLGQFISEIRSEIRRTYQMFKFNKIATKITSATPQTTITGTAPNMFEAFSTEVLPLLRELTTYTNKYNYKATTHLNVVKPEDLLLIMNGKIIQSLESGIKSQLFNAKFFDFKGKLSEDNIINLGNKLSVPENDNEAVTVTDVPYVDTNTIYIIDRNALKHLIQIDRSESQSFALNLTLELVLHVWACFDILPWKVFVKYTNENLSTLPN